MSLDLSVYLRKGVVDPQLTNLVLKTPGSLFQSDDLYIDTLAHFLNEHEHEQKQNVTQHILVV